PLPALPPGRGALHAEDARGARGRLPPDSQADQPPAAHARAGAPASGAGHGRAGRRARRPARPLLTPAGTVISSSAAETEDIAAQVASRLKAGDVVHVSGE